MPEHVSILFPATEWLSQGNVWINRADQGTETWKRARQGRIPPSLLGSPSTKDYVSTRVTGSNFGTAAGHSRFSTPKELAQEIVGLKTKEFDKAALERMALGTREEPNARKWYAMDRDVTVNEVGLVVPQWNFHLGASVDGIVMDKTGKEQGLIEIKCPRKMYQPLLNYKIYRETGWTPRTPYYRSHIWPTHYDQMQGGMAILEKAWCDYIVYAIEDRDVYCERILFNSNYWENVLYPTLQHFLSSELFPLVASVLDDKE